MVILPIPTTTLLQTVLDNVSNTTITSNSTIPTLPVITLANAFGDLTSILLIITIMAGITTRTLWRYFPKLQNGDISFFDRKFIWTAFLAFGSSLIPALGLFAPAATYFVDLYGTVGVLGSLVAVFFMAMGLNEAWNSGAKTIVARIEKAQIKRQQSQEEGVKK